MSSSNMEDVCVILCCGVGYGHVDIGIVICGAAFDSVVYILILIIETHHISNILYVYTY